MIFSKLGLKLSDRNVRLFRVRICSIKLSKAKELRIWLLNVDILLE